MVREVIEIFFNDPRVISQQASNTERQTIVSNAKSKIK